MLEAVMSLSGIGLTAAITLGLAAKKFAVEVDPRELAILEALPGANCGACGFPGCAGYAKALAAGDTSPDLCPPGGPDLLCALANILGVAVTSSEPVCAVVLCQGDNQTARNKYRYIGLSDCTAAQRIANGPKVCPRGCLGLGSCERACPFDAIEMTADGLAVIDRDKCTGCRKCVDACPRQVIQMAPKPKAVHVLCNSHDKGAVVRKYCDVGCIGCRLCIKVSPEAFVIEEFLARVNDGVDFDASTAIAKCPTKCICDFDCTDPQGSVLLPRSPDTKPEAA